MADGAVGLATISIAENIRQYEYTALTPGLYTVVVDNVTIFIDVAGDAVDISASVTNHEEVDIEWVTGGGIHCHQGRFRQLREDLDNG